MSNILGFDIGSYSVKIVKYNGSRIVNAVDAVLPDNMIKDGQIVSYDAMADFLKQTVKTHGLGGGDAALVLSYSAYILRRFEMPLMTEDQLALNLPYEFHDFLDMDKDKYYYDYAVNSIFEAPENEEGAEKTEAGGKRMDITAAAIAKEEVNELRQMFRRAGLKLVTAVPKECAFSNILRYSGVKNDFECCFLSVGHTRSTVDIFKGDVFQSNRTADIGIAQVEEQIAENRNVDIHVAREYLVANHGDVQNSENALVVYNAIAADFRKALNFYKFSNRESEIDSAYVYGKGFAINSLTDTIESTTGFRLHSAAEFMPPAPSGVKDFANYLLAVGAVLQ